MTVLGQPTDEGAVPERVVNPVQAARTVAESFRDEWRMAEPGTAEDEALLRVAQAFEQFADRLEGK